MLLYLLGNESSYFSGVLQLISCTVVAQCSCTCLSAGCPLANCSTLLQVMGILTWITFTWSLRAPCLAIMQPTWFGCGGKLPPPRFCWTLALFSLAAAFLTVSVLWFCCLKMIQPNRLTTASLNRRLFAVRFHAFILRFVSVPKLFSAATSGWSQSYLCDKQNVLVTSSKERQKPFIIIF